MLFPSAPSLFVSTLLISTAAAAPTRTHCRCTIVDNSTPPPPIDTPSAAHWTPAEPSSTPVFADICAHLGPELENFEPAKPDLYESYLARTEGQPATNSNQQRPFTASVPVNFANGRIQHDKEPRPTTRPHQRIVCRSEADPFTAYQSSFVTLWTLQIIIIIAILACVGEAVHLSLRWYSTPISNEGRGDSVLDTMSRMIRLPRSGGMWLAHSTTDADDEKDGRTLVSTPVLVVEAPNGERFVIAYEEDDDDEMNRPVM